MTNPAVSSATSLTTIHVGTRGSALALWQTEFVIGELNRAWSHLTCHVEVITSRGDRDQHTPLPALGGKGLFTAELEEGLRSGRMDIAVHSLKDLPIENPPGLVTAAILARDEARDVLISRTGETLDTLPSNAVIGTSSTRRSAQILARRPDLHIRTIRGNVDTRLRKLDEGLYDAIVLAGAGVVRMGQTDRVTQWLPVEWFTPAPGQGALAVQCRADDQAILQILAAIHDEGLATRIAAERQFLAALGGGCSEPVGAFARLEPAGTAVAHTNQTQQIYLHAWYSTPDGQHKWCDSMGGDDAHTVAHAAASRALTTIAQATGGVGQLSENSHSKHFVAYEDRPKVVMTRSLTEDLSACRLMLSQGLQPIVAPVIDMQPQLSSQELIQAIGIDTTAAAQDYDWIIFTSANAVRIFCELLQGQPALVESLRGLKVAAVGPITAQAAEEAGFTVQLVPATFTADALGDEISHFSGQRVLIPRSAAGQGALIERLTAGGARVNEIPLYLPQPRSLDKRTVQALTEGFDVMTFASGSAVRAFMDEVSRHPELEPLVRASKIACIGPQTAAVVDALGLHVNWISSDHTMQGMIQMIAEHVTHLRI